MDVVAFRVGLFRSWLTNGSQRGLDGGSAGKFVEGRDSLLEVMIHVV